MDCDPDSNLDSGPSARVNAAIDVHRNELSLHSIRTSAGWISEDTSTVAV